MSEPADRGDAVAIVGGVNIMASPTLNIALENAGALAPDGKSKAFDKLADGYGRGEGAGVVVLKRLSTLAVTRRRARRGGGQRGVPGTASPTA